MVPKTIVWTTAVQLYHNNFRLVGGMLLQRFCKILYCIFQAGCPRLLEMGGVISLYKPTTTLQPKVLGIVWCTLSHRLFPKAMDNQPEKYSTQVRVVSNHSLLPRPSSLCPQKKIRERNRGVGHEVFVSSQHFYTHVALRNSETTSWSKVEDVGFHKKARKVAY